MDMNVLLLIITSISGSINLILNIINHIKVSSCSEHVFCISDGTNKRKESDMA